MTGRKKQCYNKTAWRVKSFRQSFNQRLQNSRKREQAKARINENKKRYALSAWNTSPPATSLPMPPLHWYKPEVQKDVFDLPLELSTTESDSTEKLESSVEAFFSTFILPSLEI